MVPSVQELAKQPIIEVPSRYIRPDLHSFPIVSAASEIPVIDMSKFHSDASMHSELARLHSACKNWGFFQLVNHGVSDSLIEKMKAETQKFFNLPIEEKKKRLWQSEEDAEGFGQAFVVSEEQKLDWCDLFFIATAPPHLRKPRLFQNLPLAFRFSHSLALSISFHCRVSFLNSGLIRMQKHNGGVLGRGEESGDGDFRAI